MHQARSSRVKGASSDRQGKTMMINLTINVRRRRNKHATTTMTHAGSRHSYLTFPRSATKRICISLSSMNSKAATRQGAVALGQSLMSTLVYYVDMEGIGVNDTRQQETHSNHSRSAAQVLSRSSGGTANNSELAHPASPPRS